MKVVIVDDHPLFRKGLLALFSLDRSMEIVGEASDFNEGLQLILERRPDVAIVDLRLGNRSGLILVNECKKRGVRTKFIILTFSSDLHDFNLAKQVGVDGYVLKDALPEELLLALKMIAKGRKYYDQSLLDFLTSEKQDSDFEHLTPKEKEVLIALGKGMSNQEISERLFVSKYTVKKHVSQILAKLEVADRTQAALVANAKGLVLYAINEL